jgi:5-methylcytosine-specific restriction enzyme subunit McrC
MNGEPAQPVRIEENDPTGATVELDAAAAAALQHTGLVQVQPSGPQNWLLRPCGKVGAVRAGSLDVAVTPKVGIARLLFMLGYATAPGFQPDDVTGTEDLDLLPAMAETLCRHVQRALGPGVLQGYRMRDEALTVVRGRPRLADQFARRPGTLLPLEVTYDEYSADISENRVLRGALRRMWTVPRLPPGARARLTHLDGRLDGVQPLVPGAPLPQWQATRLNQRYQPALRLAELVLRHQSFEVGPGGLRVASFVVDMAKVFEDFVTTALQQALKRYPGGIKAQFTTTLDEDEGIRIRPDVVHIHNETPCIIVDAKYKIQSGVDNPDHYQMLAYCIALTVPVGWLVYAQGNPDAAQARIRNTGITVIATPLDLNVTPGELLDQIDELARRAWREGGPRH